MLRKIKEITRGIRHAKAIAFGIDSHKAFVDGHFYSPIVNRAEPRRWEARVWPETADILGIDFNEAEQQRWIGEVLPQHLPFYDYPDESTPDMGEHAFYTRSTAFSWLDSRMLFAVLCEQRPQRMIEIGSGFSSLLAADVNCRFLGGQLDLTCIEPYPHDFLRRGVLGISRLIERCVQDVPIEIFTTLEAGDILFIDSSHVSKTGSDVNHIYFEILPRLKEGVLIHIHDIFLPNDYPKHWVLDMGLHWNEQYLVQTMLMYSRGFEVLFGGAYALARLSDLVKQTLGGQLYGGETLWLRKLPIPYADIRMP